MKNKEGTADGLQPTRKSSNTTENKAMQHSEAEAHYVHDAVGSRQEPDTAPKETKKRNTASRHEPDKKGPQASEEQKKERPMACNQLRKVQVTPK